MNLKTIIGVTLGLVSIAGIGWGAYAYLDETYLEEKRFETQCLEWKAELDKLDVRITTVSNNVDLGKYQTRMWQLEKWIKELEMAYGPNCQNCPAREKSMYWEFRKEHNWLRQQINKIMGY